MQFLNSVSLSVQAEISAAAAASAASAAAGTSKTAVADGVDSVSMIWSHSTFWVLALWGSQEC